MSEHVLDEYFGWLTRQFTFRRNRDYSELLKTMYDWDFVWVVPQDANRIQDAKDLRQEFFREYKVKSYVDTDVLGERVSVLEILIALSRKMAFMTNIGSGIWADRLIHNLDLQGMTGNIGYKRAIKIGNILTDLVHRQYQSNGVGGFFPLEDPPADQREVELWYQMNAYLNEHA